MAQLEKGQIATQWFLGGPRDWKENLTAAIDSLVQLKPGNFVSGKYRVECDGTWASLFVQSDKGTVERDGKKYEKIFWHHKANTRIDDDKNAINAVRMAQVMLGTTSDGGWGINTQRAFMKMVNQDTDKGFFADDITKKVPIPNWKFLDFFQYMSGIPKSERPAAAEFILKNGLDKSVSDVAVDKGGLSFKLNGKTYSGQEAENGFVTAVMTYQRERSLKVDGLVGTIETAPKYRKDKKDGWTSQKTSAQAQFGGFSWDAAESQVKNFGDEAISIYKCLPAPSSLSSSHATGKETFFGAFGTPGFTELRGLYSEVQKTFGAFNTAIYEAGFTARGKDMAELSSQLATAGGLYEKYISAVTAYKAKFEEYDQFGWADAFGRALDAATLIFLPSAVVNIGRAGATYGAKEMLKQFGKTVVSKEALKGAAITSVVYSGLFTGAEAIDTHRLNSKLKEFDKEPLKAIEDLKGGFAKMRSALDKYEGADKPQLQEKFQSAIDQLSKSEEMVKNSGANMSLGDAAKIFGQSFGTFMLFEIGFRGMGGATGMKAPEIKVGENVEVPMLRPSSGIPKFAEPKFRFAEDGVYYTPESGVKAEVIRLVDGEQTRVPLSPGEEVKLQEGDFLMHGEGSAQGRFLIKNGKAKLRNKVGKTTSEEPEASTGQKQLKVKPETPAGGTQVAAAKGLEIVQDGEIHSLVNNSGSDVTVEYSIAGKTRTQTVPNGKALTVTEGDKVTFGKDVFIVKDGKLVPVIVPGGEGSLQPVLQKESGLTYYANNTPIGTQVIYKVDGEWTARRVEPGKRLPVGNNDVIVENGKGYCVKGGKLEEVPQAELDNLIASVKPTKAAPTAPKITETAVPTENAPKKTKLFTRIKETFRAKPPELTYVEDGVYSYTNKTAANTVVAHFEGSKMVKETVAPGQTHRLYTDDIVVSNNKGFLYKIGDFERVPASDLREMGLIPSRTKVAISNIKRIYGKTRDIATSDNVKRGVKATTEGVGTARQYVFTPRPEIGESGVFTNNTKIEAAVVRFDKAGKILESRIVKPGGQFTVQEGDVILRGLKGYKVDDQLEIERMGIRERRKLSGQLSKKNTKNPEKYGLPVGASLNAFRWAGEKVGNHLSKKSGKIKTPEEAVPEIKARKAAKVDETQIKPEAKVKINTESAKLPLIEDGFYRNTSTTDAQVTSFMMDKAAIRRVSPGTSRLVKDGDIILENGKEFVVKDGKPLTTILTP